jgi:ABC-type hemin transport system ATPase subunit
MHDLNLAAMLADEIVALAVASPPAARRMWSSPTA